MLQQWCSSSPLESGLPTEHPKSLLTSPDISLNRHGTQEQASWKWPSPFDSSRTVRVFQTLWNNRFLTNDRNGDGIVTQPKQYFSVVADTEPLPLMILVLYLQIGVFFAGFFVECCMHGLILKGDCHVHEVYVVGSLTDFPFEFEVRIVHCTFELFPAL